MLAAVGLIPSEFIYFSDYLFSKLIAFNCILVPSRLGLYFHLHDFYYYKDVGRKTYDIFSSPQTGTFLFRLKIPKTLKFVLYRFIFRLL